MENKVWEKLDEIEKRLEKLEGKKKPKDPGVSTIRDTFLQSFKDQFGHEYPGWGAKENGMAKNWLKSVSMDQALLFVRAYVRWKDKFIIQKGHPFGLLVANYVQLDANIKRYPQIMAEIAKASTRDKAMMESISKEEEIRVNVQSRKSRDDLEIGERHSEKLPFSSDD